MKNVKQILMNRTTRNAIFFTLFILFIYRIGVNIVTPGVDNSFYTGSSVDMSISTLFDFFGGGSLSQMGLFALGVSPYISASVMIQLLESDLVPAMSEWKHQGVDGQNKRSKWTKILTLILAFVQAIGILVGAYISGGSAIVLDTSVWGYAQVGLLLTAGCAVVVWLSDRITEFGVGNGVSVVITAGILSQVPTELNSIKVTFMSYFSTVTLPSFFSAPLEWCSQVWNLIITTPDLRNFILTYTLIFILFLGLIIGIIYYTNAERRIPVNYTRGQNTSIKKNSYLPIKLNPAGVIPIIFVQPLLILLGIGLTYAFTKIPYFANNGHGPIEQGILALTGNITTTDQTLLVVYNLIYIAFYGFLIIGFTRIYSLIQMDPEEMTKNLANQQAYIVNTRPGEDTYNFLEGVIKRTSLWGGLILFIIAVIPILLSTFFSLTINLSLLGTGMIIIVGVVVQVYQGLLNKSEKQRYRSIIGE